MAWIRPSIPCFTPTSRFRLPRSLPPERATEKAERVMKNFSPAGGAFLVEEIDPRRIFTPELFSAEEMLIGKTADDFLRNEVLPLTERIESGDRDLMHSLMQKAG